LSIKLFLLELLRFLLNKEEILDLLEEVEVVGSHTGLHLKEAVEAVDINKEVAALEEAQEGILKVEVGDQVNHMVLRAETAEVVAQGVILKEVAQEEVVREVILKVVPEEAEARASLMALQGAEVVEVAAAVAMLSLANLKKLVS